MIINNFNSVLKRTLLFSMMFFTVTSLKAQLTGTKLIPGDYASLDLAIADLNTQGVGAGGVILNLVTGNPQTAPLGGYVIGGPGSLVLTTASAANPITITGNSNVVTAPASQVSGQLFDGIFKIIGADYVTIQGFILNENAANTTIAAATNNMTEWGIALLYASLTDGCQNVSILNNTIALGATYQNAIGIYANSTHSATAIATSATATGLTGGNHNLSIKGNTISNVNLGVVVVGPTAAADVNNTLSIGGTTPAEGNTITFGLTGTFSGYANVSGTVNGILVRNSISTTVSNNSLTSNGTVTAGTLNGIQFPAFSSTAAGTYAQNINNNSFTLKSNFITGGVFGINLPSGSSTVTSSLNINGNQFNNVEYASATASGAVVLIFNANPFLTTSISNNSFNNLTCKTTGSFTFISNDYAIPSATGSVTVNNNNIVTAFSKTGAGGTVTCYLTTTGPSSTLNSTKTYTNNNFSNITVTGATAINGILDLEGATGGGAQKTISNNTLTNWIGGTSAIVGVSANYSATSSIVQNTINNITGQGAITGISIGTSNGAGTFNVNTNTITNLSSTGTGGNVIGVTGGSTSITTLNINSNTINTLSSSGASSTVAGINLTSAPVTSNVSLNIIHTLTSAGITSPLVRGIVLAGTNGNVFNNKIYNLTCSAAITTTNGAVNGILATGGTTSNIYNNVIGDLKAPLSGLTDAIRGISLTSTTATSIINVYSNSIYLNATSTGVNFGSSGIFHTGSTTATTAQLNLRNNVIINESVAAGTGLAVAVRRGTAASINMTSTSNKNMLFAGTPSASRLIYTDGTTPQQTLLNYQTGVLPVGHDVNSFTGEAFTYSSPASFFISLTGSSVDYLKPVAGITTQVESGADVIALVTNDYSGALRSSTPDCGAFEFSGVTPAPAIVLNSVTPSTTSQCVAAPRVISVNVTTISGTVTGANIGYTINGTPQANIVMTNTSGSTWEGTIPVPTPANATIAWGVSATNSLGLSTSYTGVTYSDEPLTGIVAASTTNNSVVCSGTSAELTSYINNPNASVLYSTPSILNPTTDEDLRTVKISQGATVLLNNTSTANALTGTLGAATGTAGSYSNFTSFGSTTLNAGTAYDLFVASIDAPSYFTNYATAFIDLNRDGDFADAGESIIPTTGVLLNAAVDNGNDSITTSFTIPTSAINGLTRLRVAITETGQTNAAGTLNNSYGEFEDYLILITGAQPGVTAGITNVTWSDGATTVGTGNPLTVNPTTTTTYTATITSAGCTVSPAPTVTVTVNPLPTAPTASNSAQCGTQIPTASVTSTSGLSTPTFKWYDAAVAGTVMQNSTSTTYTSNVTATTTFYVAEINTTTGCESPRTAVTVTVATADGILAAINNATICIGSSVTLTATNTNATPNQSYTYTWTGIAGSGVTSLNGSSATVTPTLPGTYTYNLAGVDGGCNAVSSVNVTVNPFVAAITPVNATCNAGNDGSFTLGTTTCGTAPYTYSVNGGAYGSIPTNLIAGTYSVLVKDANGYISAALPLTITQPATTITNPTVTNASVCQNSTSATVTASATTSVPTPQTTTVNFSLLAQPVEVNAAPGSVISTLTLPVLPAGAVITGLTLNCNGLIPNGGEYQSDAKLGFSGAFTNAATAGTGTLGFGTVAGVPYNYTRSIPTAGFPTNGGTLNLLFWDDFNDVAGGADVTFPLGSSAVTLTIDYTVPSLATITWWDAPTGGTQIGANSPFETVGTSVVPNTNTPAVYTLYAQGQNGACPSPGRSAVTVTVNALPTVNAGADQTVCAGTAVTLTGSGASTYAWNNSVVDATAFTPAATATYTVTGTATNGCTATDQVIVTVNALPTVNAGADQTVCDGAAVTLSGTVAGGTWSGPLTIVDGVAFTAPVGVHTFTYSVTNGSGCTNTDNVIVTVNALPTVNAGADQTVCEGTAVTLSGTVAGGTWSGPLTITDGVAFTAPAGVHTFTYSVTNGSGCTNTDNVIVTVNALPTVNAGADQTICEGTAATLSGSVAGGTWSGPLAITDGVAFTAPVGVHTFTYSVTNGSGCTNTDDVVVTVNALPTVNAGADQTICEGTAATLSGSVAGGTWSGPLTITDGVAFTAPVGVHTFTYSVTNGSGCTNTDDVVVTVNALPTVNAGADQTVCEGTAVTLSGTVAGGTWSGPLTITDGVAFTAPVGVHTFTYSVTNGSGCTNTDDVVVTVNAVPVATATDNGDATITAGTAATYQWIDCATGTAIAGATSQTYTATVNGTYAVVVSNGSCSDTSACVTIDYISVKEITFDMISIYPNPTRDNVTVTMSSASASIEIIDAQGKLLKATEVVNGDKIDLSTYDNGMYIFRVKTENGTSIFRVSKN